MKREIRYVILKISHMDETQLTTELKLYSDGSWSVERESDQKIIAQGEEIKSLKEWAEQIER